jgi:RNA 2',3'-cyclic 3'-phosphodiesterase
MNPIETGSPTQPDRLRLFVAVPVPDTVKDKLREVQRELQMLLHQASVGWTPPEQIHLTLRFFGSVRTEDLSQLQTALTNTCAESRALKLESHGLGAFPPKRAPRVVWAGVWDHSDQLARLHKSIETATAHFGEKPESRDFSAHLALGRIKEIRRDEEGTLREFIANHANRLFGEWPVTEIHLLQSQLGPSGARHSIVSNYSLRK